MKYTRVILASLLLFAVLAGCNSDSTPETPMDSSLRRLHNDLATGSLTDSRAIDNGKLRLEMQFSTDYDTKSWQITSSKTLKIEGRIKPGQGGEGAEVYLDHLHIDVALKASKAGLNGIKQDSMDNSVHSSLLPGFLISQQYPYQCVFAIEGFSETLISGWGFQSGDYGQSEISEKRLTETNLKKAGVTGNKISTVWDLLVKYPGEPSFHKVAIAYEFVVPVN